MTRPSPPKHSNGFDCLRLLAAAAVLFSHCFYILGIGQQEPLEHGTNPNIGFVAVYIFFAISGYLVTYSWKRDPDISRFMVRRSLRIFPGLAFVIILSFAILGPLTTTLSVNDYFLSGEAWSYLLKIFIYPGQYGLPGVFDQNPLPNVINGSLWSLRAEFGLYLLIALIGYLGLLRKKWSGGLGTLLFFVLFVGFGQITDRQSVPAYEKIMIMLPCAITFFAGVAMAQNNVKFRKPVLIAAELIFISGLALLTPGFRYVIVLTMPVLAILAAQNMRCNLSKFGDYSYGIYLWAYVIQQTLINFFPTLSFFELLGSASVLSLGMAALSWHLVEKRALAFKPRKR